MENSFEVFAAAEGIEDAIAQGVSICAPSVLAETFSAVFPAKFVDCEAISHCPRLLHAGRCAAMIVSEDVINSMHAGNIHQQDCDAVNSGSITEELGRCMNNHRDEPRNDCELIRVGDLLWSVPLSFPISDRARIACWKPFGSQVPLAPIPNSCKAGTCLATHF